MSGRVGDPSPAAGTPFTASDLPLDAAIAVLLGAALPGTPVPPLEQLALGCDLDLVQVVAGLEALMARRAVELVPGSNRLVTRRIPYRIQRQVHASLAERVQRSGSIRPGMEFRTLVRSVDSSPLPGDVALSFGLAAGAAAVHLRRERMLADEVVVAGTSWLRPTDWLPPVHELADRLFESASLASLLEQLNDDRPLQRLSYELALAHPPPEVAALFGPARDELAWWVQSVNGIDGVALEVSLGWLRADVFRVLAG